MKIEIGKTYLVYSGRWMTQDEEIMKGSDDKQFIVRTEWKHAEFIVTPQDEEECEVLQYAMDTDDEDNEMTSNQFVDFVMKTSMDGNTELSFMMEESFEIDEMDEIQTAYDEDWFSGLDGLGYESIECYHVLWGQVKVEEYEDSDSE